MSEHCKNGFNTAFVLSCSYIIYRTCYLLKKKKRLPLALESIDHYSADLIMICLGSLYLEGFLMEPPYTKHLGGGGGLSDTVVRTKDYIWVAIQNRLVTIDRLQV